VIPTPLLSGPPVAGWQLADSRALGEIVEEMLISAQLAADPGTGELLDPGELVADTVTSMYVLAADAGVTLHAVTYSTRMVLGSRASLRRALTALVDNALAHTSAGGHVTVSSQDPAPVDVDGTGHS
jgi:two-component system OmpR family sensor kinase